MILSGQWQRDKQSLTREREVNTEGEKKKPKKQKKTLPLSCYYVGTAEFKFVRLCLKRAGVIIIAPCQHDRI